MTSPSISLEQALALAMEAVLPQAPARYPPTPVVRMQEGPILVNPAEKFVDVEARLDGPATNTCYFDLTTANGDDPVGVKRAIEGGQFAHASALFRIRPGDEPRVVLRVPILSANSGTSFWVAFPSETSGVEKRGPTRVAVVFDDTAPMRPAVTPPMRRPDAVAKKGERTFVIDPAAFAVSEDGKGSAGPIWKDQFPNGRTPNNGEVGLYAAGMTKAGAAGIVLEARRAARAQVYKEKRYDWLASLITTETVFSQRYGYFEARLKVDMAHGSWPAFWLLPASGGWPPEIDIFEVMVNASWPAWKLLCSQHAGKDLVRAQVASVGVDMRQYLPAFDMKGVNTYGVRWDEDLVTWFVNGVEICQQQTWFHEAAYLIFTLGVGGAAGRPGFERSTMTIAGGAAYL